MAASCFLGSRGCTGIRDWSVQSEVGCLPMRNARTLLAHSHCQKILMKCRTLTCQCRTPTDSRHQKRKIEQQLDFLLHPYARVWPIPGDGPRWYHVSPARVAMRLVMLRTIFPSGIDLGRVVSSFPEVMEVPDDLLEEFFSLGPEIVRGMKTGRSMSSTIHALG
eukprot:jgi/Botrbrau1/2629/Bobra.145_1s0047.1